MHLCDDGEVLVNERDSLPGFTRIGAPPKLWQAAGMNHCEPLGRLGELAIERHGARRARQANG